MFSRLSDRIASIGRFLSSSDDEVSLSDFDMGDKLFVREAAKRLNTTPLSIRRAGQDYLFENRHVLKQVWDQIQEDKIDVLNKASPRYPSAQSDNPRKGDDSLYGAGVTAYGASSATGSVLMALSALKR